VEILPIAYFRSPLKSKFGIPRQSGLVSELLGTIEMVPEYRHEEALRGLEEFDYAWLIWEFSENRSAEKRLTVRPPRLGGNRRMGVFATRSPFRPNNLGLSCVRIVGIEQDAARGPVIHVAGADLMDGTPIYDIKPYVAYADSHPEARSGFVDKTEWKELDVEIPAVLSAHFQPAELSALRQVLAQDPRPRYQNDAGRIYGMPFGRWDIRFRVSEGVVVVVDCVETVSP
jgi:tRNA-Thr(GGU) m(6)t(6)A37 methyltransferase TsaA